MIIYNNTFEDIKLDKYNIPIEDSYYASSNLAIVADGITRDPIGIKNFNQVSFEECILKYPKSSGASMAAKTICKVFEDNYDDISIGKLSLRQTLIKANENVKKLNHQNIKKCDYLENDFYGAVASSALIKNNVLYYCYICDCGIAIFDKLGKLKFKTTDDMETVNKHFDTGTFTWDDPEARVIVRKNYRNNVDNIYSYGAITGEKAMEHYLKDGSFQLDKEDIVIVYSDGFVNYLYEKEFYYNLCKLINGSEIDFKYYLEQKGNQNYRKFGKEKTLVVMKNE